MKKVSKNSRIFVECGILENRITRKMLKIWKNSQILRIILRNLEKISAFFKKFGYKKFRASPKIILITFLKIRNYQKFS